MKRLTYCLHPRDAEMAGGSFEIDENPLRQAGALSPEAWFAPGGTVATRAQGIAVEMAELVLAPGASLPGGLRLDALLCTRSQSDPGYACWTQSCRELAADNPVQLADQTLFRGAARDFVDVYVWVSGTTDGLELRQLMAQCSGTAMFRDAAMSLLIGNGQPTMPWVASTGGSAMLARIARDALCRANASARGLYRTSFALHDRFWHGGQAKAIPLRTASFSCLLTVKKIDLTEAEGR
jgi:hypothetical protein